MSLVSIYEAKTHLSDIIARLEQKGDTVTICRHGRPVAELRPLTKGSRIKPDHRLRKIKIHSDSTKPTTKEWSDA